MTQESDNSIREARLNLRKIYDKYAIQLKEVAENIDKMLETLEQGIEKNGEEKR